MALSRYLQTYTDFRIQAMKVLPRAVFDYIDGGAESEEGVHELRRALDGLRLVPDAPPPDVAPTLNVDQFGVAARLPLVIAPTGLGNITRPGADLAIARAARDVGIPYVLSTAGTTRPRAFADITGLDLWFQLYVLKSPEGTATLLHEAREAGARVLQITLDTAVPGRRLRDLRSGFTLPFRPSPHFIADVLSRPAWLLRMLRGGFPTLQVIAPAAPISNLPVGIAAYMQSQLKAKIGWDELARLRDKWHGPVQLKGFLRPQGVERARALGFDGLVLSNHGGRQLDFGLPALEALSETLSAAGRMPVAIDSGFQTGSDVLKAIALGARAVQIGRGPLFAVACHGEIGVHRLLQGIKDEMERSLILMGRCSLGQLSDLDVRRR
jgi:(S)-mandelate dehydrogenase